MHNKAKTIRTAFFILFTVIIFSTTLSPTLGNRQANSATREAVDDSVSIFSNSPTIWTVTNVTRPPNYNESMPIEANVTDDLEVSTVILSYSNGTTWRNVTMAEEIPTTGLYNAAIPAFPWPTHVEYMVYTNNTAGEWSSSPLYGYYVADYYPPIIQTFFHFGKTTLRANPECNETVLVYANATSEAENASPIYKVKLYYWNGSLLHPPLSQDFELIELWYVAEIPPLPWNTQVWYRVYVEDWAINATTGKGNSAVSETKSYQVLDSYGPTISNLEHSPDSPQYNETVRVSTNVSEPQIASGVYQVVLSYFSGSQWQNVTMIGQDTYTADIPTLPWNTLVQYKIYACDNAENWIISETHNYRVTDSYAPIIESLDWSPKEPKTNMPVIVTASVSEPAKASGTSLVTLSYNDGFAWINITMTTNNGVYTGQIPVFESTTHIEFRIYARDNAGNLATSLVQEYTVEASEPPISLPLIITIIALILAVPVAIIAMRKLKKRPRKYLHEIK
jgi:hypothetical protein